MKQQSFDDIIKEKAEQYEAPIPADAWDNIVKGKKKKRRYMFFWWTFGLLLMGIGIVILYNRKDARVNSVTEVKIPTQQKVANNETVKIFPKRKIESPIDSIHSLVDKAINNRIDNVNQSGNISQDQTIINQVTDVSLVANVVRKKKTTIKNLSKQDFSTTNAAIGVNKKVIVNNVIDAGSLDFLISEPVIAKTVKSNTETVNGKTFENSKEGNKKLANDNVKSRQAIEEANQLIAISNNDSTTIIKKDSSIQSLVPETAIATQPVQAKKTSSKKSTWSADISITPFMPIQENAALLYLTRSEITSDYKKEFKADQVKISVQPSLAYTIAAKKKINKRLDLGAGIQYLRITEKVRLSGTETTTTYPVVKRVTTDNTGTHLVDDTLENISTGIRTINAYNSYNSLSIPMFLQYSIMEKRHFMLSLTAGAYVNIVKYKNSIKGDFTATYKSGMQQGSQSANMGLDLFAGIRLSTPARKRYRFFAEPVLRYGLMKVNTADMINAKRIRQAGISIGISYGFK